MEILIRFSRNTCSEGDSASSTKSTTTSSLLYLFFLFLDTKSINQSIVFNTSFITTTVDSKMPPKSHEESSSEEDINLSTVAARVSKVTFKGISRTKEDLLVNLTQKTGLIRATNFEEVVFGASLLKEHLTRSLNGIFRSAVVTIDASPDSSGSYDVTVTLRESGMISGSVQTIVQSVNNEPSVVVSARASNFNGRAESLVIEGKRGSSEDSSGFSVSASKPFLWTSFGSRPSFKALPIFGATIFDSGSSNFPGPSGLVKTRDRGTALDYTSFLAPSVMSKLRLEYAIKEVSFGDDEELISRFGGLKKKYSKMALKHVLDADGRSFVGNFPASGSRVVWSQELAGKPGNQSFLKQEVSLETNKSWSSLLIQACFRAGLLVEDPAFGGKSIIRSTRRSLCPTERFFVGGPLSVRGFGYFGIGERSAPKDDESSSPSSFPLGSSLFWAAGLHAYAPLPFLSSTKKSASFAGVINRCLRMHAFFNAAAVRDTSSHCTVKQSLTSMIRTSIGGGVCIQASRQLRFEINYALPLSFDQDHDVTDKGFSFGFGASFTWSVNQSNKVRQ